MKFQAAIYRGSEGRTRWAVYSAASSAWYFPTNYGRKAAEKYAQRLNTAAPCR